MPGSKSLGDSGFLQFFRVVSSDYGSIYHLYTTYSPCLLGDYMLPIPPFKGTRGCVSFTNKKRDAGRLGFVVFFWWCLTSTMAFIHEFRLSPPFGRNIFWVHFFQPSNFQQIQVGEEFFFPKGYLYQVVTYYLKHEYGIFTETYTVKTTHVGKWPPGLYYIVVGDPYHSLSTHFALLLCYRQSLNIQLSWLTEWKLPAGDMILLVR